MQFFQVPHQPFECLRLTTITVGALLRSLLHRCVFVGVMLAAFMRQVSRQNGKKRELKKLGMLFRVCAFFADLDLRKSGEQLTKPGRK